MFRHGGRRPQPEATSLPPSEAEVVHTQDWHELAAMYFLRARQDHDELAGLLVDIDATKPTNDELGHEVGNYLIDTVHSLTAFIPKQVRHDETQGRPADIVTSRSTETPPLQVSGLQLPEPQTARIGGDEFGILLPHTGIEGAQAVKDRLVKALDEWLNVPANRQLKERRYFRRRSCHRRRYEKCLGLSAGYGSINVQKQDCPAARAFTGSTG